MFELRRRQRIALLQWFESLKKIACVLAIFYIIGLAGTWEHTYTRNAEVYYVAESVVVFEDEQGYLWDWVLEKGETYHKGDKVKLSMHTSFTHNKIEDDVIKKITSR